MTLTHASTEPPASSKPPRARVRYVGIDLARFIAIIGMIAAHLIACLVMYPEAMDPHRALSEVTSIVTGGTAAALFAVLGGVSIVFATRRQLRDGARWKATGAVAMRGLVIIVIGVLLGFVENGIVVVLTYFGVAMILVSPLVAVRSWILATIAGAMGLVTGWLNVSLRKSLEIEIDGPHISVDFIAQDPLIALRTILITGEYPAVTWVVYLLVGILIGRALTAATAKGKLGRTAISLAAIGVVVATFAQLVSNWVLDRLDVLGIILPGTSLADGQFYLLHFGGSGAPLSLVPTSHLIAIPHSGTVIDLMRTIGLACAIIGILVFLCDRERPALAQSAPKLGLGARLLDIVRAAGAAPLTIYTLHIIISGALAWQIQASPETIDVTQPVGWWIYGASAFALQLTGVLAIGAILSITGRRGPLETALSKIVSFVVR